MESKLFASRSILASDRAGDCAGAGHFSFKERVLLMLALEPMVEGDEGFVRLIEGRT